MKLIPPLCVEPYVCGNKNDYNNALAIADAVILPEMRFVPLKTPKQQDIQALIACGNGVFRNVPRCAISYGDCSLALRHAKHEPLVLKGACLMAEFTQRPHHIHHQPRTRSKTMVKIKRSPDNRETLP